MFFANEILSSLHFSLFSFTLFSKDHCTTVSAINWELLLAPFTTISDVVVSSTYFQILPALLIDPYHISCSTLYLLLLQGLWCKNYYFYNNYCIINQPSSLIANHCSVILNLIARNLQSSDHGITVFA